MGNALRLGIARIGLAINKWQTKRKLSKRQITILILGLQGTGKSTVAQRLSKPRQSVPDSTYVQTKGFHTYEIRKKKLVVRLHDIGGHESIRELWTHYYADAHGVIFVVDSSKPDDLTEAGQVLAEVLKDDRIQRKPVLLLANKQDESTSVSEVEVTRTMDLVTTVNAVRCLTRIDVCAANGLRLDQGIFNGFKWLLSYIELHYLDLNERVLEESSRDFEREKALFNLRRATAANNGNSEHDQEHHEDGIVQVQKPGELVDLDTDPESRPKTSETAAAAAGERMSPEGAADSSEDFKHKIDLDDVSKRIQSTFGVKDDQRLQLDPNKLDAPQLPSSERKQSVPPSLLKSGGKRRNKVVPADATSTTVAAVSEPSETINGKSAISNGQKLAAVVKGVDNPAFEPNVDDRDSHVSLPLISRPATQVRPIRSSAFSIRSNSTEADPDGPGELIMVTTTAEVHKTQETTFFEDVNRNSNITSNIVPVDEPFTFVIAENAQEQNQLSPTLSYLSGGRISHKTSLESIDSDPQQRVIENHQPVLIQPAPTKSSPNHFANNNNNHHQQLNNIRPSSSRASSAARLNEPANQKGDSSALANNNTNKTASTHKIKSGANNQDGPNKHLQNATPNRKEPSPVKGHVSNGNITLANKPKEKPQLVNGVSPIKAKNQQR